MLTVKYQVCSSNMAVVQVDVLMASRTMTISLPFLSVIIVVIVVFITICGRVSLCDHHTQLASTVLNWHSRKGKKAPEPS